MRWLLGWFCNERSLKADTIKGDPLICCPDVDVQHHVRPPIHTHTMTYTHTHMQGKSRMLKLQDMMGLHVHAPVGGGMDDDVNHMLVQMDGGIKTQQNGMVMDKTLN
jgi:hypothetical protein